MSNDVQDNVVDEIVGDDAPVTESETNDSPEAETPDVSNETDAVKEAEIRAGKAIAAQRKKYQEDIVRLQQENEALKRKTADKPAEGAESNENMIFDPKTNRYFDINTPLGLQVWREQEAERVSKVKDKERVYEDAASKIMQGNARYKNFDVALDNFKSHGTNDIVEALISADDPAEIVHYLGSNVKELERLSSLPPHQVKREVYRLETALQSSKKKVSQAADPVEPVSEIRNTSKRAEDQSLEEREAFYRNKKKAGSRWKR